MQLCVVRVDISNILHRPMHIFHTWEIIGYDMHGHEIIESQFDFQEELEGVSIDLSPYPADIKSRVSNVLFSVKNIYLEVFSPRLFIISLSTTR